jgi:hypothetical protein
MDTPGAVLLGAGLMSLLVAVSEGQSWGWGGPRVATLLVLAVVFFSLWLRREAATRYPLVQVKLLRHRALIVTNVAGFLISLWQYLFMPLLVNLVQTPKSTGYGLGSTVLVAGAVLVPFSILSGGVSPITAVLGSRLGMHRVVPIGALFMALAPMVFAVSGGSLLLCFVVMGIAGIGAGLSNAAIPGIIVRAVPAAETGSALAFNLVVRFVGFAMGSALSSSILAGYTSPGHTFPRPTGFVLAMYISAGMAVGAAAISSRLGGLPRSSLEEAPPAPSAIPLASAVAGESSAS